MHYSILNGHSQISWSMLCQKNNWQKWRDRSEWEFKNMKKTITIKLIIFEFTLRGWKALNSTKKVISLSQKCELAIINFAKSCFFPMKIWPLVQNCLAHLLRPEKFIFGWIFRLKYFPLFSVWFAYFQNCDVPTWIGIRIQSWAI